MTAPPPGWPPTVQSTQRPFVAYPPIDTRCRPQSNPASILPPTHSTPLSTATISTYLDAMEVRPRLLHLGLGQLRDEEHVHRYEVASVGEVAPHLLLKAAPLL